MMNKKRTGFSLAELLIALLVISIVLSAAIPTLTRKSATSEQIWRWSSSNNSAYFGVGSNQSAIIGADSIPFLNDQSMTLEHIIFDDEVNVTDLKFSNYGDKLVLLKKSMSDNAKSHFVNSHISFYNMTNSADATTNDIHYAGRIASDTHNLAFGIGALQNLDEITDTFDGDNTAIGHYTLMRNSSGSYNTAIGEKALSYNEAGSLNTALGFKSLFRLGGTTGEDTITASNNTAIGSGAMQYSIAGTQNTAVGSDSLAKNLAGSDNTAIGYYALNMADEGTGNTAIGANSCALMTGGDYNICIGNRAGVTMNSETNYGLFIGSGQDGDNDTPLISGFTQPYDTNDKELSVNTRIFAVKTFDSGSDAFYVEANKGTSGYEATGPADNVITMALYNIGGLLKDGAMYTGLRFSGDPTDINIITTRTASVADSSNNNGNINFNDGQLKFDLSKDDKVNIYTDKEEIKELQLNGKLSVENNSSVNMSLSEDYGFQVISSDSTGAQLAMNDETMYINLPGTFSLDSETLSINESGAITVKNGYISMGENAGNGVYISSDDVTIPGVTGTYVSASVQQSLINLSSAVEQAMSSGGGGGFSDIRLKDVTGDCTIGLDEINALEVKNFTFKNDKEKTPHVGVIAQQLQKVFPNSVFEDKKSGYLKIKTEEIFYAMVNSIKELFAQIQDLTAKITGLDKRITELEKQNQLLLEQNKAFEKRLEKLEKQNSGK